MAVTDGFRDSVRARPGVITAVLTIIGYAVVLNAFEQVVPMYPSIGEETVKLFSSVITVINAATLLVLLAGVYYIRNRDVRRHRRAMLVAVGLEILFLVIYVWKVGGGGELASTATGVTKSVYLVVLAIHLVCSALSVPLVTYALTLGLSHSPGELTGTIHAKIGRIAVAVWSVSLALGIVTHVMLQVWGSELRTVGMTAVAL